MLIVLAVFGFIRIWRSRAVPETIVLLDRETFPSARYGSMQSIADKVALTIDQLIPGEVESYPRAGIVCFIARAAWKLDGGHFPPITLVGPKEVGEPGRTHPNTVRIALNDQVLQRTYSGEPELVFELAHELAHIKMDARYDNYLDETFAVSVSLKVLSEFGFDEYRRDTIRKFIWDSDSLPQSIKSAIERQDWNEAALFWQSQSRRQKSNQFGSWNVTFGMLGSLILETVQQPVWGQLLGFGAISDKCVLSDGTPVNVTDSAMRFKVCLPAIGRMNKLSPALKVLGY